MTATVKLPEHLEASLRQRCAQEGRSISDVIRDALTAYLAQPSQLSSPWALGMDLFGRHAGPPDLADARKDALLQAWQDKAGRHA